MNFINNWMRDEILQINSYAVQPAINKLKLDAMESPFLLDENTTKQLLINLNKVAINRYPASHKSLHKVVKDLMNIPNNLDIILGNGSDELIQLLMLACNTGNKVLGFNPSFVMYEMIAKWCKLQYLSVNLNNEFDIDEQKSLKIINEKQPKIIFIAYPNNPTGNNFNKNTIEKIITTSRGLVVIDEAYYAYSDKSFINEINKYDNLVVLRTISKIGFAGLRLGVLIGNKFSIIEFDKLRMPYNINALTMIASEFLLEKKQIIEKNATIIKQQREVVIHALNNFQSISAYKSDANFILFKAKNANDLFNFLNKNNILIKNMLSIGDDYLRVTISHNNENKQFLNLVRKFYQ